MILLALFLAFAAGIAMAFQGSLNTGLGKIIGLLEATFIVHLVGLAILTTLLFLFRLGQGNLSKCGTAPWYLYLGGALGVVIIYAVVASMSRVGVAAATTAIIVGQVGTALVLDHFGVFGLERVPFSFLKVAGIILLAAGARLMLVK
ncbi:MAG: DMT family transporter [Firmicutes bacterium]|jgi:transporter family-2 protein|nr:DMT family transporter [Bacillota bacterium]